MMHLLKIIMVIIFIHTSGEKFKEAGKAF
jgi:hypothetical protein